MVTLPLIVLEDIRKLDTSGRTWQIFKQILVTVMESMRTPCITT